MDYFEIIYSGRNGEIKIARGFEIKLDRLGYLEIEKDTTNIIIAVSTIKAINIIQK